MSSPSIVSAGYMPLDVITHGRRVTHRAGGTAANVAAILAYLGWRSALAGQTGDDEAGQVLLDDLRGAGVDVSQIHRPAGMATPRLVHRIHAGGHAFAYACPACRRALPRSRPLTLEQARACAAAIPRPTVYFFDRANAATVQLAERYADAGSVVVYEPSVPANAELLGRAMAAAQIVKHSGDRSVGGLDALAVQPRRGQLRIITHGAAGLEVRSGAARRRRYAALPTLTVDPGGAGDWTTAGLIAIALRSGALELEAIDAGVRFGQALAALSCTAVGARGLMDLSRRAVLRRADAVLAEGAVTSRPRFRPAAAQSTRSGCATCLLPPAREAAATQVA
jgi:fructokinase